MILAVLGLDERPVVRRRPITAAFAPSDSNGLWHWDVASLYGLGTCWTLRPVRRHHRAKRRIPAEGSECCHSLGRPAPTVVDCPVNGVLNLFGANDVADEEIALDLQVVAG